MVMKQKDTKTKSKKPSNKWVKSDSNVDIGKVNGLKASIITCMYLVKILGN